MPFLYNIVLYSPYSWTYFKFNTNKLKYYSSNLKHLYQSGHPHLFEPDTRTTYIGLNRLYESRRRRGKGLCQVYCKVTSSHQPFEASMRRASAGLLSGIDNNNLAEAERAESDVPLPPPPPSSDNGANSGPDGDGDIPSTPPPAP